MDLKSSRLPTVLEKPFRHQVAMHLPYDLAFLGDLLGITLPQGLITYLTVDSRKVQAGSLFFALKGACHDGHDFLETVRQQGAIAAVVDASYQKVVEGLILIPVPCVLEALQQLAKEVQARRDQVVIAVTGSVGKTTTKEFIATLLETRYTVEKTPGNHNSQIGLPLAVLNCLHDKEVFVVEMGMSRLGEIERLVNMIPPDIAVITHIGHSHLDTIEGGLEGVALAKSEILCHLQTQVAVIQNQACHYRVIHEKKIDKITFSLDTQTSDVSLVSGPRIREQEDLSPPFSLPFLETHFCENMMGAIAVARVMKLTWEEILHGMNNLKPACQRFEKIEHQGVLFINDSYNASPESMIAAFQNLPPCHPGGRVVAVLAEMVTLGSYSVEGHQKVGQIALEKANTLFCLGAQCVPMMDQWKASGKEGTLCHDLKELKERVFSFIKPQDIVLLKGSNRHQLWKILEE
ncbi:MAG: UDP-N-acetylmuramoyl-tripeptide--D-alanyl-D-alanine ligase [Candidatus Rhabdochlamydia sp.]